MKLPFLELISKSASLLAQLGFKKAEKVVGFYQHLESIVQKKKPANAWFLFYYGVFQISFGAVRSLFLKTFSFELFLPGNLLTIFSCCTRR